MPDASLITGLRLIAGRLLIPPFPPPSYPHSTSRSSRSPWISRPSWISTTTIIQTLKVMIPPWSSCAADTQQGTGISLRGSPYYFKNDYSRPVTNVFMMEGCSGSALLLDQRNITPVGCATVCPESNTGTPTSGCYGLHCCQAALDMAYPFLSFTQITFNHDASSGSSSCLVASLISSESVNQYAGRLSGSDPPSAVPVLLGWMWISNLPADNDSHASCSRYGSDSPLTCSCNEEQHMHYYGNPYVTNGCRVPKPCKGCRGACYSKREQDGSYIPDKYYACDAVPIGSIIGFAQVILFICT